WAARLSGLFDLCAILMARSACAQLAYVSVDSAASREFLVSRKGTHGVVGADNFSGDEACIGDRRRPLGRVALLVPATDEPRARTFALVEDARREHGDRSVRRFARRAARFR